MGVRRWLARAAVAGPHLLLVEAPGAWRVRVAVEQEATRRGWRLAHAPADADVVVVCGSGLSEAGDAAAQAVWGQLPGPRAWIEVHDADLVHTSTALDEAAVLLSDDSAQRQDAAGREQEPATGDDQHGDHSEHGAHHGDHGAEHGGMDHGGHGGDHGGMDHGGHGDHGDHSEHAGDHGGQEDHGGHEEHGGMGHGHMDMSGPGGIALASGGSDRDGLDMDVLHLPLGPVLSHWPAGLVLTLSLQGDVVTEVVVDGVPDRGVDPIGGVAGVAWGREVSARRCDAAASLLSLAGAGPAAGRARLARDQLLDPAVKNPAAVGRVASLQRLVRRSWLLRWSLRDLAPVAGSGSLQGDVHGRLLRLVDLASEEARTGASTAGEQVLDPSVDSLDEVLPGLLVGVELATVRLAVASVAGFYIRAGSFASGGR